MRRIRTLVAAGLLLVGVVTVGATSTSASAAGGDDGSRTINAYPRKAVVGEFVAFYGQVPGAVDRTVKLQHKSSSGWKTKATASTYSGGYFQINVKVASTASWRYYAKSVTTPSKTYKAVTGTSRTVEVVKQKVTEAYVINGTPCPGFAPNVTVVFGFYPARWQRLVVLTKPGGSQLTGTEDRQGRVAFTYDAGSASGTYSVKAATAPSMTTPTITSKSVKYTVAPCAA